MHLARVLDTLKEVETQEMSLSLKCSIRDNGWDASEIKNQSFWTMHFLKIYRNHKQILKEKGYVSHPNKNPPSKVT